LGEASGVIRGRFQTRSHDQFAPASNTELNLVQSIANDFWRLAGTVLNQADTLLLISLVCANSFHRPPPRSQADR
jgi:hypothetical protein